MASYAYMYIIRTTPTHSIALINTYGMHWPCLCAVPCPKAHLMTQIECNK